MGKIILKEIKTRKRCPLCDCRTAECKVYYRHGRYKTSFIICEPCLIKEIKTVIKDCEEEKEKEQKGE